MFSNYYLINGEYEDSITFAKSSLVNLLKICGTNHTKTAEAYYNLALVNIKANKIQDALGLLKKAKFIFETNNKVQTSAYATINLKMGLLMLNRNQINQCVKIVQKAIQTYDALIQNEQSNYKTNNNIHSQYEQQKAQAYQILSRCCQLSKNRQKQLQLSKSASQYLQRMKNPQQIQKILRICLFTSLTAIAMDDASRYLDIISLLPCEITPKTYHKAFTLLKVRIRQGSLVQNFCDYLQNIASIDDFISVNGTLKNWRSMEKVYQRETVNDFISLTEEILYFLGEGFVTGSLREALNA